MKYFTTLFSPLKAIFRNQNSKTMSTTHGIQLKESGFLNFADTIKLNTLQSNLINSFDIYNEDNYKIAHVDGEELAEFNFDFFLPGLNKMLEKREFKLSVKVTEDYESTNEILINGNTIKLFTQEELNSEDFAESAPRNFFREVNRQLNMAKLDELFYLLYGWNDLHVLLLTQNQSKIIADNFKDEPKEIPYLP